MRIIIAFFFSILISVTTLGQTAIKVPNGTIYSITIRDSSFNFDRAFYSIFIPDGIETIRGSFVHQHGCTMEGRGMTTAYDIQYQAFAKKWHLAVVGPDLYPKPGSNCHDWKDPIDDGSGPALQLALSKIGAFSNHPELATVPWLLWGHSGGGCWVLGMLDAYPKRIIAAVCYSAAFDPQYSYPEEVKKIPVLLRHAGSGDFNKPGVNCWETALHTFSKLRSMDGLVSIAFNKGENHNLSYLRSIVIPFYDAVLAQRLPQNKSEKLNEMDQRKAWLCDTITTGAPQICKASTFAGNKLSMFWMPDSLCATKFKEFITTNTVIDSTPPAPPWDLVMTKKTKKTIELSWKADADIESGIRCFNIYENGKLLIKYPPFGDFQSFSTNGDDAVPVTPQKTTIRFYRKGVSPSDKIEITSENRFGLESLKAEFKSSSK